MNCLYGNSKEFLEAISDNYWYFANIHKEALAWRVQPTFEVPDYKGRGPRPKKMAATTPAEPVAKIAGDDTIPWRRMYLGEGSKGPIYSDIKCLRIYRAFAKETGEVPIKSCWLFIRRLENGETRFSVSIEQCFNEAKDKLGMDHYEFRSWTAWHRHMVWYL
ncbi:MAG TPA: hypothetical protein VFC58_11760 [Desulfosporosinus sp.]|nr:hypothetical protein [Desulfosporosinus sp.]